MSFDFDALTTLFEKHHVCRLSGGRIEILAVEEDDEGRRVLVAYEDGRRELLDETDIDSGYELAGGGVAILLAFALSGFAAGAVLTA